MSKAIKKRRLYLSINKTQFLLIAIACLLLIKFFRTLFLFEIPLGYDPGMYRYLFLQYGSVLPPFSKPELELWALEHPQVLFIFSSYLMKLGVPVDWLLGWIWNSFALLVPCVLAWITAKRTKSTTVGILVLVMTFLSQAYYDGFVSMYWKALLGLFFCILTFYALEKKSWWMVIFALLTVGSHQQAGFIMILAIASWWTLQGWQQRKSPRKWLQYSAGGGIFLILSLLLYAPSGFDFVLNQLKAVLRVFTPSYGGAFPSTAFYLQITGILFALGIYGFVFSFHKEKGSVWQFAVIWSAIFVFFKLHFYRRFYLHLDFFLLPYAAIAFYEIYKKFNNKFYRLLAVFILTVQGLLSTLGMEYAHPAITQKDFEIVKTIEQFTEDDQLVLVPENQTAMWVRGWLSTQKVGAPGLFDFPWSYEDWWDFIYGSHDDRVRLLSTIKQPVVIVIMPYFFAHYRDYAIPFVNDPCFHPIEGSPLLRVDCNDPTGPIPLS